MGRRSRSVLRNALSMITWTRIPGFIPVLIRISRCTRPRRRCAMRAKMSHRPQRLRASIMGPVLCDVHGLGVDGDGDVGGGIPAVERCYLLMTIRLPLDSDFDSPSLSVFCASSLLFFVARSFFVFVAFFVTAIYIF